MNISLNKYSHLITNPASVAAGLCLFGVMFYSDTIISLYDLWTNPDNPVYSHGFLLVAVSLYLLYIRWGDIQESLEFKLNALGLVFLLGVSLAWFLGCLGQVQIIQQISLAILPMGLVWSLFGLYIVRRLFLPLGLPILAIPIWDFLHFYLQITTAPLVVFLLNATGISSVVEGTYIYVSAGTFEVARGCSGLSQFIVAITIGCLYSAMRNLDIKKSVLVVFIAMLTAFFTNLVRIYIVTVAGELTAMEHFLVHDHYTLGWVLFGIGIFSLLFFLDKKISDSESISQVTNNTEGLTKVVKSHSSVVLISSLALVAMLAGPILLRFYDFNEFDAQSHRLVLPDSIAEWVSNKPADDWKPHFSGADLQASMAYKQSNNDSVSMFMYFYHHQTHGKEAVQYSNRVYDDITWRSVSSGIRVVDWSSETMKIKETVLRSGVGKEKLVWHWYRTAGVDTGNRVLAKLLNVWGMLMRDPEITVIVMAVDFEDSYEESRNTLQAFLNDFSQDDQYQITEVVLP